MEGHAYRIKHRNPLAQLQLARCIESPLRSQRLDPVKRGDRAGTLAQREQQENLVTADFGNRQLRRFVAQGLVLGRVINGSKTDIILWPLSEPALVRYNARAKQSMSVRNGSKQTFGCV